jgi:hypothetical protein
MAVATPAVHCDNLSPAPRQPGGDNLQLGGSIPDDCSAFSVAALLAENAALRTELAALRLERTKLAETQQRIMDLLNVRAADRLIHDVRNVLNERSLLKALIEMSE